MNERIKELFGQALDETVPETWTTLDNAQVLRLKEKFAELIIRECAKEAFNHAWNVENYEYYNDIGWDCLPVHLQSHIEEHFGVEK